MFKVFKTPTPGLCGACKTPIKDTATRCKHCGADQGWRRMSNGLVPVLSLCVAGISVTPLVAERVNLLRNPPKSDVVIAGLDLDLADGVNFLLVNLGEKSALLPSEVWCSTGEKGFDHHSVYMSFESNHILLPNEPKEVRIPLPVHIGNALVDEGGQQVGDFTNLYSRFIPSTDMKEAKPEFLTINCELEIDDRTSDPKRPKFSFTIGEGSIGHTLVDDLSGSAHH